MYIYGGMMRFVIGCMKLGIVENVFEKEGVEEQVYNNRFGMF